MKNINKAELTALQNAANNIEAFIHVQHQPDKRKTISKYFATINGVSISPVLPYNEMNCFLLGWIKCNSLS